ncbi:hypothetical protein HGB07_02640 [Candidatus Roizmanbacteria bacterium]|nr:hypothetical protein [Candidatus Roizmanbacteria bacterium]
MSENLLKVGFDLDGVILYNPVRNVRPIIAKAKKMILHKSKVGFYVPKTPLEQFLWYLIHKSSFIPAPGMKELYAALADKKFEAHIVTARFDCLKDDFLNWVKKIKADTHFTSYIHNAENEQPHIFKKKMIEKLDLDIFIDDNWDIVQYLQKEFKGTHRRVYWIYNFFDRHLEYPHKFPHMKQAVEHILHYNVLKN